MTVPRRVSVWILFLAGAFIPWKDGIRADECPFWSEDVVALGKTAYCVTDRHSLYLLPAEIPQGETLKIPVLSDLNPDNLGGTDLVNGWSVQVCLDQTGLELVDVELGGGAETAKGGNVIDYFEIDQDGEAVTSGALVDVSGGTGVRSERAFEVLRLVVKVQAGVGEEVRIDFCDGADVVPVVNSVVVGSRAMRPARIEGASYVVTKAFVRGDSDGNSVIDLADAIRILRFIVGRVGTDCHDAMDANDDGVVTVSDAVYLAMAVFDSRDFLPPHPVPGGDPTRDEMLCNRP